mmetsp:Transcript_17130/g.47240  ORF Transcript_17130/g.47240 Transcript_17130/m.47240 type:complete len:228 (+) Transcript_17130:330-1013(+)
MVWYILCTLKSRRHLLFPRRFRFDVVVVGLLGRTPVVHPPDLDTNEQADTNHCADHSNKCGGRTSRRWGSFGDALLCDKSCGRCLRRRGFRSILGCLPLHCLRLRAEKHQTAHKFRGLCRQHSLHGCGCCGFETEEHRGTQGRVEHDVLVSPDAVARCVRMRGVHVPLIAVNFECRDQVVKAPIPIAPSLDSFEDKHAATCPKSLCQRSCIPSQQCAVVLVQLLRTP